MRAVTHPYPGAFIEDIAGLVRIWEGRIGEGGEAPNGSFRVALLDGVYDALDWTRER